MTAPGWPAAAPTDAVRCTSTPSIENGTTERVGDLGGPLLAALALAEQHELVVAPSRHPVGRSSQPVEAVGHRPQEQVAVRGGEAVAPLAEPVDADEQQGHHRRAGVGASQRQVEPVEEDRAVGEPGALVLEDLAVEPLVHGPLGADVAGDPGGGAVGVGPQRRAGRDLRARGRDDVQGAGPGAAEGERREEVDLEHGAVDLGHPLPGRSRSGGARRRTARAGGARSGSGR